MVLRAGSSKFSKKQQMQKVKRLLILFVKGSMLLTFCLFTYGLYAFILTSPYFYINKIEIAGLSRLEKEGVEDFLNIPPKTNIFALKLDEVRKKVESHPWVKSAKVARRLPDTLKIVIEEYKPVAIIEYDGLLYYVDEGGMIFKKISSGEPFDYPLISITGRNTMDKERFEEGVKKAIMFLKRFSELDKNIYRTISEINFNNIGLINVFLFQPRMQIIFHPENMEEELKNFVELLKWTQEKSVIPIYIYFTSQNRAIVKLMKITNTTAYSFKDIKYVVDKKEGETNG